MSQTEDRHQAERWQQTAAEDLRAAKALQDVGMYAHACFLAQQCAEKAVKALWYLLGEDPWGHSVQKLVMQFPDQSRIPDAEDWQQRAAALDKFYIPTRYPNGLPDLTPQQSYFAQDAVQAIGNATFFLEACERILSVG